MSDIVERLRKLAATADRVPIFADAADEIERLQAGLREAVELIPSSVEFMSENLLLLALELSGPPNHQGDAPDV